MDRASQRRYFLSRIGLKKMKEEHFKVARAKSYAGSGWNVSDVEPHPQEVLDYEGESKFQVYPEHRSSEPEEPVTSWGGGARS